ncbi:MAG TPA: two-component regulator propeller domain-containing protein [Arenimonas sp.]|nr:two-component regulator propeller domain-containing protein [Arenimonas sp.]
MPRGARQSTSESEGPDLRAIARRRSLAAAVVAVLLGAALLFDLPSRLAPVPLPAVDQVTAPTATPPAPARAPGGAATLRTGSNGCLEPGQWGISEDAPLERGEVGRDAWQPSAAGGRLAVDPCGAIWALWYNSWTVVQPGDPDRVGSVQPPRTGATTDMARHGVASFAFDPSRKLWVLAKNGSVARHTGDVWELLPALDGCRDGQLLRWRQEMWVACPFTPRFDPTGRAQPAPTGVLRWNETGNRWDGIGGAPAGARRMVVDARDRLWTAATGALARRDAGRGEGWMTVKGEHGTPTALATLPDGFAIGTEAGLWLFDSEGQPQSAELDDVHVVGLAAENGRLWVATWRHGLYLRENGQWHQWRFAQGLPDDLVRDVVADARGRLWVGSSPGGWMLAAAAATQIKRLPALAELPGRHYHDACAAAIDILGDGEVSGAIARARIEGQSLVFFNGQQACPLRPEKQGAMPVFWRRDDGSLLELAYNGRGGSSFNNGSTMGAYWTVRLHQPLSGGGWHSETLPLPDPLPPESPGSLVQFDGQGHVWIATGQSGIWQFDGQGWRRHAEEAGYSLHNRPQAMLADGEGLLWVGSSPSWLFKEKRHAGPALQRWQDGRWHPLDPNGPTLSVFALASGAGLRWIGDNGKLWRLGPEGISALDDDALRKRGLITNIVIDAAGHPWLTHGSTTEGLSYHDGERARIVTSRQGLFTDAIDLLAFDAEQRLWLLAKSGEVAVYERASLIDASR